MLPNNIKKYWNDNEPNVDFDDFGNNPSSNEGTSKTGTLPKPNNTGPNQGNAENRDCNYDTQYAEFVSQHYRNSQQNPPSESQANAGPDQYGLQHSNKVEPIKNMESIYNQGDYPPFSQFGSIFKNPGFYKPIMDIEATTSTQQFPTHAPTGSEDHWKPHSSSNFQSNPSSFPHNNEETGYGQLEATNSYSHMEAESSMSTQSTNFQRAAGAYNPQSYQTPMVQDQQYSHVGTQSNQPSFANERFSEAADYGRPKVPSASEASSSHQNATSQEPASHYGQPWSSQTNMDYTSPSTTHESAKHDYREDEFQKKKGYKRKHQFENVLREKKVALGEHQPLSDSIDKNNEFRENVLAPIPSDKQIASSSKKTKSPKKSRSNVKDSDVVSSTVGNTDNIQENLRLPTFNDVRGNRYQERYKSLQSGGTSMMAPSGSNYNNPVVPNDNNPYNNQYDQSTFYSRYLMSYQRNASGQAGLPSTTASNSAQHWPRESNMNDYLRPPINPASFPCGCPGHGDEAQYPTSSNMPGHPLNYLRKLYGPNYPQTESSEHYPENDDSSQE